jgi:site-specific DNA-methyltransferase (adenine-specific)/modification methylase
MNKEFLESEIFNEDCLTTLGKMRDDSVDLVITSPPYNMNLRIRRKSGKGKYENGAWGEYCSRQVVKEFSSKYEGFDDNLPIEEYNELHTNILKELLRVSPLVFYNVGIVTGSKRSVFQMIGDFNEQLKEIIVWDKGHGQPAMAEHVLNRRTELILVFDRDDAISRQFLSKGNFERGTLDDLWLIKRERSKHTGHGAVFPERLVEIILENFSEVADTVYDPFIGTGTTAVVAKKLNRKFLGSEIDPKFIKVAKERLNNVQQQLL